ncbi:Serpentine Receptor, class I [Caenorhabditis elegans]|uniref:Serpentine Receptor, class I n=1 Tax=Caenorhabditis elegans TaxID=6239 RepID=O61946_CAEEL|nr:Serpentine Receptor, class I [Caenorhabditis elegans]CCD63568.1 Serpentine Receptor, class I [Caenorhabditis elegans]|eukprot:NP_503994.1 Serpentine Receptor, class I [Caenorhabditis elegans]
MSLNISFETPKWLVTCYHSSTIISVFINTLGIYLIKSQSGAIDSFRYYLLWFTICSLSSDICLFFLVQPIPLLPIWAGYINGPLWSVFGISTHMTSLVGSIAIGEQAAALTMCFVRKYQALSRIRNEVSKSSIIFVWIFTQIVIAVWVTFYYFTGMDRSTSLNIIAKNYPTLYPKFLELEDFQLYVRNEITTCFLISAGFMASIFIAIIIYSTVRMINILKNLEKHVSAVNFKKHKAAVGSLIAQFLTTPIAFVPPVASGVLLCFDFQHIQVTNWAMLALASCHGTVNCLVMILTCPPYRGYLKRHVLAAFRQNS